jgi:hypothetical protein
VSERELKAQVQKGDNAARVLKDPLIQEALTGMRETVYHNIRTSNFKQFEEREDLYKMLKAIDAFEKQFTDVINGGKKAKTRLKDLLNKLR